ncbi:Rrf2 family transcriptional regulator [Mucilaginibacter sp.]|uniref:Rrf2 family transcriptional regulator n=1 Tax=Mucilaginibacter sp. TaxID=1882438 RepID=UPI0028476EE3|nr:Rrf2 family transcriptional regulator [Mucilaginibacter sp.]MDR3696514.1 Rrf2 family transcriptional regulator [Mucilaginibacter sp.]
MNGRFSIAIHIMTLLTKAEGELLSSELIASSINANAALVRKELSNLRNNGLIISKEGATGGYSLGKDAALVRLSDIYQAVKQQSILGQAKNLPNPACPVGRQINKHLDTLYKEVEDSLTEKLGTQTLADFASLFD